MLKQLKIGQRIYLLGFLQLFLITLVAFVSYSQMNKIGMELIDIAEEDIPLSNMLTSMTEHQLEQAILFERLLFKSALIEQGYRQYQDVFDQLERDVSKLQNTISTEFDQTLTFIHQAITLLHDPAAQQEFAELKEELATAQVLYQNLTTGMNSIISRAKNNGVSQIATEISKIEALEDTLDKTLIAMQQRIQEFTLESTLKAEKDEQAGQRSILIISIIAILLGGTLPFLISQSIVRPVNSLARRLKEIAAGEGDLTHRLPSSGKDELADVARSFNRFLSSLRDMVIENRDQADALGCSSEESLQVMQHTLENVEQQSQQTAQVASLVEQMSTSIENVAQNSAHASNLSTQVREQVNLGSDSARHTQTVIEHLANEIKNTSNVIESLVAETNNIGSVLEAIQGIAEQTNLLALNAAIEAARAGDTGRGFAVVADEVRSLAKRTQTSTVDIQELVQRLQTEANNAVSSMTKGSQIATDCLNHSLESSKVFDAARTAVNEINDVNQHISQSATEQSHFSQEVNQNLRSIADIAQTTSDGARSATASNEDIAQRLIELHNNLGRFQV